MAGSDSECMVHRNSNSESFPKYLRITVLVVTTVIASFIVLAVLVTHKPVVTTATGIIQHDSQPSSGLTQFVEKNMFGLTWDSAQYKWSKHPDVYVYHKIEGICGWSSVHSFSEATDCCEREARCFGITCEPGSPDRCQLRSGPAYPSPSHEMSYIKHANPEYKVPGWPWTHDPTSYCAGYTTWNQGANGQGLSLSFAKLYCSNSKACHCITCAKVYVDEESRCTLRSGSSFLPSAIEESYLKPN